MFLSVRKNIFYLCLIVYSFLLFFYSFVGHASATTNCRPNDASCITAKKSSFNLYVRIGGMLGAKLGNVNTFQPFVHSDTIVNAQQMLGLVNGGFGAEYTYNKFYIFAELGYKAVINTPESGKYDATNTVTLIPVIHNGYARIGIGAHFRKLALPLKIYFLANCNVGSFFIHHRLTQVEQVTGQNSEISIALSSLQFLVIGGTFGPGFSVQVSKHFEVGAEILGGFQTMHDIVTGVIYPNVFVKVLF